jgi:hypothetical protein
MVASIQNMPATAFSGRSLAPAVVGRGRMA